MPSLNGALTFSQVHNIAMSVAEYLDLNVPRSREIPLQIHAAITERRECLARRCLECPFQVLRRLDDPHALPTPASGSFQKNRIANGSGSFGRLVGTGYGIREARHDRNPGRSHAATRLSLVPHRCDRLGGRSDEDQTGGLDRGREVGPLGKESVSGMDRRYPFCQGELDDRVAPQIALRRWSRADAVGLIGLKHVRGQSVGLGIHGDRPDPTFAGTSGDSDGDFAAICDKDGADQDVAGIRGARSGGGTEGPEVISPRQKTGRRSPGLRPESATRVLVPHRPCYDRLFATADDIEIEVFFDPVAGPNAPGPIRRVYGPMPWRRRRVATRRAGSSTAECFRASWVDFHLACSGAYQARR